MEPAPDPPRVLIASPPARAIGGVATHSNLLLQFIPGSRRFDQWWPLRSRSRRFPVRLGVHLLGLARWSMTLAVRRPEVIHMQVTAPGLARDVACMQVASWLRIPIVSHVHTSGLLLGDASAAVDVRFKRVLEMSARTIVISRSLERAVRSHFPGLASRLVFLPNPAPPLAEAQPVSVQHSDVQILCVGEVGSNKGQAAVVEAAERLNAEGFELTVSIVGPWGDETETGKERLRSSPITRLCGTVRGANLTAAYDASDIFVLFSKHEGEPLAMLEAMSRGLPVIATRVGGIPETLAESPGNYVLDRPSLDALMNAIRTLALDPALRATIGTQNRAYVTRRRTPGAHVVALLETYSAVLSRSNGS